MAKLILIRGLPGSGKSTLAEKLLAQLKADGKDAMHFEADQYYVRNGVYKFNPAFLRNAHEWCQESVNFALSNGIICIVSNTCTQYWEAKPYLQLAKQHDVPIEIIKCIGEFDNVHGVPEAAIDKMAKRWESLDGETVYNPLKGN
jgi:predicted kinase